MSSLVKPLFVLVSDAISFIQNICLAFASFVIFLQKFYIDNHGRKNHENSRLNVAAVQNSHNNGQYRTNH
jgi:hypothetical protein